MGISTFLFVAVVGHGQSASQGKCGVFGDLQSEGLFLPKSAPALSTLATYATASKRWVLVRADGQVAYRYDRGKWAVPIFRKWEGDDPGTKTRLIDTGDEGFGDQIGGDESLKWLNSLKGDGYQLKSGDLLYIPKQSEAVVVGKRKGKDYAAYISFDGPSLPLADVADAVGFDYPDGRAKTAASMLPGGLEDLVASNPAAAGAKQNPADIGSILKSTGNRHNGTSGPENSPVSAKQFVDVSGRADQMEVFAGDIVILGDGVGSSVGQGISTTGDADSYRSVAAGPDGRSRFAGYGFGGSLFDPALKENNRLIYMGVVDRKTYEGGSSAARLWVRPPPEGLFTRGGSPNQAVDISAKDGPTLRWFASSIRIDGVSQVPTSPQWQNAFYKDLAILPRSDFEWATYIRRLGPTKGLESYSFAGNSKPGSLGAWSAGAGKDRYDALVAHPREFGYAALFCDVSPQSENRSRLAVRWGQKTFRLSDDPWKGSATYRVAAKLFWLSELKPNKAWKGGESANFSSNVVPLTEESDRGAPKERETGAMVLRVSK